MPSAGQGPGRPGPGLTSESSGPAPWPGSGFAAREAAPMATASLSLLPGPQPQPCASDSSQRGGQTSAMVTAGELAPWGQARSARGHLVGQPTAPHLLDPEGSSHPPASNPLCVLTQSLRIPSVDNASALTALCRRGQSSELKPQAAGLQRCCCDCGRLDARHPAITHGGGRRSTPAPPECGLQVDPGEES